MFKIIKNNKDLIESDFLSLDFSIGEGWIFLINDFFKDLKTLNLSENFKVKSIKEKYGDLIILTKNDNEEVKDLIQIYKKKASETCIECSKKGNLNISKNKTLTILCEECSKLN